MIFFMGTLLKEIEKGETGRLVVWGQGGCTYLCTTEVAGGEELIERGAGRHEGGFPHLCPLPGADRVLCNLVSLSLGSPYIIIHAHTHTHTRPHLVLLPLCFLFLALVQPNIRNNPLLYLYPHQRH